MSSPTANPPARSSLLPAASALVILAALVTIYGPLVRADPVLSRDDKSLLEPLKAVHSLGGYLRARSDGRILDLQPVRDASFLCDLTLTRWLGVGTFHATNLLLWLVIVALAFALMTEVHGPSPGVLAAIALFSVHPVFVGSVGWISARKHLLACLFILGATLLFERAVTTGAMRFRTAVAIFLLYLASTFSQPITALWPLWAVAALLARGVPVLHDSEIEDIWFAVFACVVAMTGVLVVNLWYYSHGYAAATSTSKFADSSSAGPLAFGRYFADFLWPTRLSTQYAPGDPLELVGLGACALLVLALLSFAPRRRSAEWGAFYLFPLLLVTVRMTNIYVSDTYALVSGVGLMSLGLLLTHSVSHRFSGIAGAVAAVGFATLTWQSTVLAKTWRSDAALWEQAWKVSPSPITTAKHAWYLLHGGLHGGESEEATALLATIPIADRTGEVGQVCAQAVYESQRLSLDEKIRQLEEQPSCPWRNYYLAALQAGAGRFPDAHRLMQEAMRETPRYGDDWPAIAAESVYFCHRAAAADCDGFATELRRRAAVWDEARYRARLAALER